MPQAIPTILTFCNLCSEASSSVAVGGSGAPQGSSIGNLHENEAKDAPSMRLYLSQIQEYAIEYSETDVTISIRTEAAWYELRQPMANYAPWMDEVLKWAHVTVKIMGLLLDQVLFPRFL